MEGSGTSNSITNDAAEENTGEDEVQVEPTQSEMERERLISRAEQVREL